MTTAFEIQVIWTPCEDRVRWDDGNERKKFLNEISVFLKAASEKEITGKSNFIQHLELFLSRELKNNSGLYWET